MSWDSFTKRLEPKLSEEEEQSWRMVMREYHERLAASYVDSEEENQPNCN